MGHYSNECPNPEVSGRITIDGHVNEIQMLMHGIEEGSSNKQFFFTATGMFARSGCQGNGFSLTTKERSISSATIKPSSILGSWKSKSVSSEMQGKRSQIWWETCRVLVRYGITPRV